MEPLNNPWSRSCSSPLLQSEKIEWTWEENKLFENALAELNHDSPSLFEQIALKIPGKNVSQIKEHYDALIEDIKLIESESDYIPSPKSYRTGDKGKEPDSHVKNKIKHQQRKRGVLWTPKEHELFLQGLEKYGKGDWKSISRNCVMTRTSTQVASHAQKYFIRLRKSRAKKIKSSSMLN